MDMTEALEQAGYDPFYTPVDAVINSPAAWALAYQIEQDEDED